MLHNSLFSSYFCVWKTLLPFDSVEIIVVEGENGNLKGENAGYQDFLIFPQCFQKPYVLGSIKLGIVS